MDYRKKALTPCQKRQLAEESVSSGTFGISRVCRMVNLSRSSFKYVSNKNDVGLEERLRKHADEHPREGFWKFYFRIRNAGVVVNHKRVHRVYKKLGMPLKRKVKKRLPARRKETLAQPPTMHHTWSIDFMSDALSNGRKFRSFHVIDDCNREILFIETDYSLPSSRVLWVLNHLINKNKKPQRIRMDNGPEFVAKLASEWSKMHEIEFLYIQPGKPTQNAYIERFNGTYRRHVLDCYQFDSIDEVREVTEIWVEDYNYHRPHDALNGMSPMKWKYGQQA